MLPHGHHQRGCPGRPRGNQGTQPGTDAEGSRAPSLHPLERPGPDSPGAPSLPPPPGLLVSSQLEPRAVAITYLVGVFLSSSEIRNQTKSA